MSGFLPLDRAWAASPHSPFAGRHKRHYPVWRYIAEQAAYMPMGRLGVGQCSLTKAELADACSMSPTTVMRSVRWLVREGLIRLSVVRRRWQLEVVAYPFLRSMRDALTKIAHAANTLKNAICSSPGEASEKSGPNLFLGQQPSTPRAEPVSELTNFDDSKKWTMASESGPKVDQTHAEVTSENKTETDGSENQAGPKVDQKSRFLSKNRIKEITTTIVGKILSSEEQMPKECSPFDIEMAKLWASRMKEADAKAGRKLKRNPRISEWAKVVYDLRTLDNYSEDDIRLAIDFRFEDPFYSEQLWQMGLGNLRNVSLGTGLKKSDTLIARAKEAQRRKEAAEEQRKLAEESRQKAAEQRRAGTYIDGNYMVFPSGNRVLITSKK